MVESLYLRRLAQFRKALLFLAGCSSALFVTIVTGDLSSLNSAFPSGWFVLWLLTIIGSVPLGIVMLIGSGWKELPMVERRATAMGFLAVGFVDLLGLAIHLAVESAGPVVWLPVGLYMLGLFAAYSRAYAGPAAAKEEVFP
jgi:hypothetical protein